MTKMVDAALSSAGGKVVLATSSDEKHTPENIIDGRTDTFWMTTGMFPQQFIISFSNPIKINTVTIQCYNVRCLSIEKSASTEVANFEKCTEKELQHVEGQLQTEEFAVINPAVMEDNANSQTVSEITIKSYSGTHARDNVFF
ncbi:intraflagellar transport protein 25 homolog isoform X2 [Protopterus annectens]|uniref:intraflagellar transport protein 25 homolog isoform X2 n=1 Tax=Protopterus annectens TaxID=7888 RepID=UPI001CF97108|nr:intraflagellar transport protein 25 homolog isoform X2 [Protopterus annectens]